MSLKRVRFWFTKPDSFNNTFEGEKLLEANGLHIGAPPCEASSSRRTVRKHLTFSHLLHVVVIALLIATLIFNTKHLRVVQQLPQQPTKSDGVHVLDGNWTIKGYNFTDSCASPPIFLFNGTTKTQCLPLPGPLTNVSFSTLGNFTLCLYRNGNCSPTQLYKPVPGGAQCENSDFAVRFKIVTVPIEPGVCFGP